MKAKMAYNLGWSILYMEMFHLASSYIMMHDYACHLFLIVILLMLDVFWR